MRSAEWPPPVADSPPAATDLDLIDLLKAIADARTRRGVCFPARYLLLAPVLRTAAFNLLRLSGFQSIRAAMQAEMNAIKGLVAMVRGQQQPDPCLQPFLPSSPTGQPDHAQLKNHPTEDIPY